MRNSSLTTTRGQARDAFIKPPGGRWSYYNPDGLLKFANLFKVSNEQLGLKKIKVHNKEMKRELLASN